MRFFMLSDLHLVDKEEADDAYKRIKKLCTDIRKSTFVGELVLFVILGDIANRGISASYDIAEQCLDLIKNELVEYTVKFEFVPGNHDLEKDDHNLVCFDRFISKYSDKRRAFNCQSVYSQIYEGVNFIFADSTLSREPSASGKLDIEAIAKEVISSKTNVLFCHHALMQSHIGSHDNIENPQEVYEKLNKLNIEFLFHGHVHRTAVSIPKEGIIEIGCGSLTGETAWEKGLYNQFAVACVQDGKITYIERWVDTSDGSGIYAQNRLYPKVQVFADPNTILKKQYPPVENYINRTITPYAEMFDDPVVRILSKRDKIALSTVVKKRKKVLLLSDAGMGKSLEIQNLAYELYGEMHTFLYSLKDYINQDIYEILPVEYRRLSPNRYLLLFDGYDEMNTECREIFEKKLRAFINDFVGVHIVITSRNNFCRIENGKSSKFDGFEVFLLDKLDNNSVCRFLENKGIDVVRFCDIAKAKKVYDMLSNPFYLTSLAQLFMSENDLPEKSKMMEALVERSFSVDDKKFPDDLESQYNTLFAQLEKVAIVMQMMQKNKLDDRDEYQELFQLDIRELSKKSGLLNRINSAWEFTHNNFREYLSARFLSKLTQEKAVSLFSDEGKVKVSWVNTLGYLAGIELKWDLLDWMISHSPSTIVKFESDRLSSDMRTKVFEQIFCKYEKQSLYFNDDFCDEYELAIFSQSPNTANFLLDRISNPRNIASQFSAINILRHFTSLFGLNDDVRTCLVNCCNKYPSTPKHVCRMCLLVLAEQKLGNAELTKHLMELFGDSEEDYIRLGMYEYLSLRNEHNSYPQYFLSGIKYICYRINGGSRVGNEQFELVRILKSMSTPESIASALKCFSKEKNLHFYDVQEVISANVNTAIKLYQNGHQKMYDVALECYVVVSKSWNNIMSNELARFFLHTNTLPSTFVLLAEYFEDEPQYINSLFYSDSNAIDYLKDAYLRSELKNPKVFHNYVKWYIRDAKKYSEYSSIIKMKEGVELPVYEESIDYERLRLEGKQQFFDSLFNPKEMERMLSELISCINDPDIVVGDLLNSHHSVKHYSAHWYLQSAIYRYASATDKVADFFKLYEVNGFIIHEVASCLESNSNIILSDDQISFLKDIIKKTVDSGIFEEAIEYYDNRIITKTLVPEVLKIILFIEYTLEEKELLQLTELPCFLFDEKNEGSKYQYLEHHLDKDKIKMRLEKNANSGHVQDIVLGDHFGYFSRENDSSLCKTALEVCKNATEYSYVRRSAWKYLYKTMGTTYLAREVVPIADGDFLVEICGDCNDLPRDLICEAMEKQYRKTPSLSLLAHMIMLGSHKGLKIYYKIVKSKNSPPENETITLDGPTAAIECISNPKYLPILKNMLCIAMKDSFSDLRFRGLKSTIVRAFVNCGQQSYKKTTRTLKKCLRRVSKNEDNFRLCNYIINEVESAHRINKDVPLTLEVVKTYLSIL